MDVPTMPPPTMTTSARAGRDFDMKRPCECRKDARARTLTAAARKMKVSPLASPAAESHQSRCSGWPGTAMSGDTFPLSHHRAFHYEVFGIQNGLVSSHV